MVQQNNGDGNSEVLYDKRVLVPETNFQKIMFVHFPHKANKSDHFAATNYFFLGAEEDNADGNNRPYIMAFDIDDGTQLYTYSFPYNKLPGFDQIVFFHSHWDKKAKESPKYCSTVFSNYRARQKFSVSRIDFEDTRDPEIRSRFFRDRSLVHHTDARDDVVGNATVVYKTGERVFVGGNFKHQG